ncbi:hypothetical protein H2198_009826 [Neophaeococcomyces mojaviensis]|uniref:Uncharacterized protein n=1 Tax=Neophaeococcomyces mojaviensis TaxID=3383035 RepID=A0ACC2ZTF3_9EURO|nr:hypothetical protein H2198_009826 [Knufia sp. JES_112]
MATIPVRVPSYERRDLDSKVPIVVADAPVLTGQMNVRRYTESNVTNTTASTSAPSLPRGWIEMKDPSGKPMFYNTANGQTSWQRPAIRTLPPGYQKALSPDGKPIFIHTETGTVSYEWPSNSGETAPPATSHVASPTQPPFHKPADRRLMNLTKPAPAGRSQSMVHVDVNLDTVKAVPGVEQAFAVHQLSTNNNTKVLSKQLATDMSQTTVALRDTTITAASLATRQAKVVGKTMISPKRMQKVSRKFVIQTGAMTLQAARACKTLGKDMVDAADKKGKYQPKQQRPFIPYNANAAVDYQQQGIRTTTSNQFPQQGNGKPQSGLTISANANANFSVNATVPARKPVRKPVQKPFQQGTGVVNASGYLSGTANASYVNYDSTTYSVEKPPIQAAAEIEASQEVQAQQQATPNSSATQNPSQQTIASPQMQQMSQGNFKVHVQGQLQANASLGVQATGSVQRPNLTMNSRPQIQSNSSLASPPPSYDQAVRPSRPTTGTPTQGLSYNSRPQTTQQSPNSQSGSTQDSDIGPIAQVIDHIHVPDSQSEHTANHGHMHPASHALHQQHQSHQQHQAHQQHKAHQQNQSHQQRQAHEQHQSHQEQQAHRREDAYQQHDAHQEHQPYQEQQLYNEPTPQQNYMTGQSQQAETESGYVIEQNQTNIEQQAVYQDTSAMTGSTGYSDQTDATYEVYAQETVMPTNDGGAVGYEEVYFEGESGVIAHQEVVYMDGEGEIAYEEATMYVDSNGEYGYEEEYAEVGECADDEYGMEEDVGCEADF